MENKAKQVINPCIQICTVDWESGLCIGCSRTSEEITNWHKMTVEEQIKIVEELKNR